LNLNKTKNNSVIDGSYTQPLNLSETSSSTTDKGSSLKGGIVLTGEYAAEGGKDVKRDFVE
jgi:hypothetical protein